jgi:hypothetical protein
MQSSAFTCNHTSVVEITDISFIRIMVALRTHWSSGNAVVESPDKQIVGKDSDREIARAVYSCNPKTGLLLPQIKRLHLGRLL